MNLLTKQEIEALAARLEGPTMTAAKDLIAAYFGDKSKCLASIPADPSRDADLLVTADIKAAATLARTCLALMTRLEDAEAAQALVVERAVRGVSDLTHWTGDDDHGTTLVALQEAITAIRALAPASGVEALAALRAERDAAVNRVSQLEAALSGGVLTKNDSAELLARLAAAEGRLAALTEAGKPFLTNPVLADNRALIRAVDKFRAALATVTPPADTTEGRT